MKKKAQKGIKIAPKDSVDIYRRQADSLARKEFDVRSKINAAGKSALPADVQLQRDLLKKLVNADQNVDRTYKKRLAVHRTGGKVKPCFGCGGRLKMK